MRKITRRNVLLALKNANLAIHGPSPERKIILYGTSCISTNGKKIPIYIKTKEKQTNKPNKRVRSLTYPRRGNIKNMSKSYYY